MVWNDLLDRLESAGLNPVEEIYIDNYGNTLPLDRPEFRGRYLRCARGVIRCGDFRIEAFLFPSESHLQDFMEIIGEDPSWLSRENAVFHFPESDPAVIGDVLEAISKESS
jgi:hypothetical protein